MDGGNRMNKMKKNLLTCGLSLAMAAAFVAIPFTADAEKAQGGR